MFKYIKFCESTSFNFDYLDLRCLSVICYERTFHCLMFLLIIKYLIELFDAYRKFQTKVCRQGFVRAQSYGKKKGKLIKILFGESVLM